MHTALCCSWSVLGHSLCFEAWEGKDVGKDNSEDEVIKSEMGIKLYLFLICNEIFHPPSLADPVLSKAAFKDCAELVLLTFSVQEPEVTSKAQKHFFASTKQHLQLFPVHKVPAVSLQDKQMLTKTYFRTATQNTDTNSFP